MRGLDRFRFRPDRVEVDELAVVLRGIVGPDRLHGFDALSHQLPAGVERGAVVGHLLGVPATPDPEQEPPVRHVVDRGDLLGGCDRSAFHDKADAGTDLQRGGRRCRCGEGDERVQGLVIHLGQFGAARPRALAVGGNVGVLSHPERLKPSFLERRSEFGRVHRISGREDTDTEIHGCSSSVGRTAELALSERGRASRRCRRPRWSPRLSR